MRVLLTKWRRKPTGIDMERNYVSVTLCIQINLVYLYIHPSTNLSTRRYVYIRGVGLLHRICGHDTIAVLHLYNIFI